MDQIPKDRNFVECGTVCHAGTGDPCQTCVRSCGGARAVPGEHPGCWVWHHPLASPLLRHPAGSPGGTWLASWGSGCPSRWAPLAARFPRGPLAPSPPATSLSVPLPAPWLLASREAAGVLASGPDLVTHKAITSQAAVPCLIREVTCQEDSETASGLLITGL